jgi:hypothetical protein
LRVTCSPPPLFVTPHNLSKKIYSLRKKENAREKKRAKKGTRTYPQVPANSVVARVCLAKNHASTSRKRSRTSRKNPLFLWITSLFRVCRAKFAFASGLPPSALRPKKPSHSLCRQTIKYQNPQNIIPWPREGLKYSDNFSLAYCPYGGLRSPRLACSQSIAHRQAWTAQKALQRG